MPRALLLSCLVLALAGARPHAQSATSAASDATGVIAGTVTDDAGKPVVGAYVGVARRAKRWNGPYVETGTHSLGTRDETDDRGRFRLHSLRPGAYVLKVSPQRPDRQSSPGHVFTTYFPGESSLARAVPIVVRARREHRANVRLVRVPLSRISGTVRTSGPTRRVEVSLRPVDEYLPEGDIVPAALFSTYVDDKGAFVLDAVPSGDYTLTAQTERRASDVFEFHERRLTVSGPIQDLALSLAPPVTIDGRVEWDGTGPVPWPATNITGTIRAIAPHRPPYDGGGTAIQADGSIRLTDMYGLRRIEALSLPSTWTIKDITVESGATVRNGHILVTSGVPVTHFRLVLTNRTGRVLGRVLESDGKRRALGDLKVLLMPRDPNTATLFGQGFTSIEATHSNNGGHEYILWGILPGDYLIAAIDGRSRNDASLDTDVMLRLRAAAKPIAVVEGENPLDLEVVPIDLRSAAAPSEHY
jgi:hypothetical protein